MEEELSFKRFSDSKQEQIRQFVAYAQLMGLTGKDLVSIGGKLDRIQASKDKEHRLEIVKGYVVKPIGKTPIGERFKLEINGTVYHFKSSYYTGYIITNTATNKKIHVEPEYFEWGRTAWEKRKVYNILYALYTGAFVLP